MPGPTPCPPRPKNAAATRDAMLVAARSRFLQESYENVGLREIAGDAGVDVALVSRYFGSKEELFKEVLRGDGGDKFPLEIASGDLAERLTALVMDRDGDQDREKLERLLIILRSASSPKAAEIVRKSFQDDVLTPLAARLQGSEAGERAGLALAILMGSTILRTVMSVEPMCRDTRAIAPRMTKLFEAALAEPAACP